MDLNNNLSSSLSTYLQNGDICNYLNIEAASKTDYNNLTLKFNLLDSLNNKTIFDFLFLNINHQLIVAECSYKSYLNLISVSLLIYEINIF